MWSCTSDPYFRRPVIGRLRYAATPMAIIDLVAILPFWLPMFIEMDLRFVRALRLFRLFRLFKIGRYASAIVALSGVFARKKEQLSMTFFTVSLMVILAASVMYYVENAAQPENFRSIAQTMWWAVVTLTTVGYGDIYPVTTLGQLLGAVIALSGVILIALPAGIVAAGFAEELNERNEATKAAEKAKTESLRGSGGASAPGALHLACPHCGKDVHLTASRGATAPTPPPAGPPAAAD